MKKTLIIAAALIAAIAFVGCTTDVAPTAKTLEVSVDLGARALAGDVASVIITATSSTGVFKDSATISSAPWTASMTLADEETVFYARATNAAGSIVSFGTTTVVLGELVPSVTIAVSTPYFSEDFSGATTESVVTSAYRENTLNAGVAMYRNANSTTTASDGLIHLGSGIRFTIGENGTAATLATDALDASLGCLDLSGACTVYLYVGSVTAVTTTKKFQVYIDNNTSSSGASRWASVGSTASRIASIDSGAVPANGVISISVPANVGYTESFLCLRNETDAGMNIDIDSVIIVR